MRHDPVFAAMAREAIAEQFRRKLEAEAAEHFDAHRPASPDQRGAFINAYVQIAGWKTPALPTTCRRK